MYLYLVFQLKSHYDIKIDRDYKTYRELHKLESWYPISFL